MTFHLSQASLAKLEGVHLQLVAVVKRAIELTAADFKVIEGVRSLARQKELYAQGRTRPGKIVTDTLASKHRLQPDGFGHAVDLGPPGGPDGVDWEDRAAFDAISAAMFAAAKELSVALRWGADWDRDGKPRERGEADSPHFELAP